MAPYIKLQAERTDDDMLRLSNIIRWRTGLKYGWRPIEMVGTSFLSARLTMCGRRRPLGKDTKRRVEDIIYAWACGARVEVEVEWVE